MSASKWTRIKWNQANARLANAPFENLFGEQERTMSALDDVIHYHADNCQSGSECDLSALSRAELAQLRADLQAAQERSAEQARQLDAARKALLAWHIVELNECGEDIFPLMKQLDEIDLYESGDDLSLWAQGLLCAWLAANPAPQEAQP